MAVWVAGLSVRAVALTGVGVDRDGVNQEDSMRKDQRGRINEAGSTRQDQRGRINEAGSGAE
jgi:hypothetical protein